MIPNFLQDADCRKLLGLFLQGSIVIACMLLIDRPALHLANGIESVDESALTTATKDGNRADDVRFNRDIRPILSEACFACHGFDEQQRQSDLRLDVSDEGWDGVVQPGQPDHSQLYQRLITDDTDLRMPPTNGHQALKPGQINLIRQWIEQGAVFEQHWSFDSPRRPPLPELPPSLTEGAGNPIDHFVRHRLHQQGLTPAPEADRYTLVRRLYLDLIGLPPTANEIEQFVNDPHPQAYPNLVRRLLASPHFGEKMAIDWLDAARYADTNGYSIDGGRHAWIWRDWVIQSFNDNLPYDQFISHQIAGDLIPDRTPAQWIATGFQRNNMVTHEGGTIPEENLANYNADRIKTFGESMLGLTLACAQCHTHKYDPITHDEYYQLTAFFNTINDRGLDGDGGVNPVPKIEAKTVLKTNELEPLNQRIKELESELASINLDTLSNWENRQQTRLTNRGSNFQLLPIKALNVTTPNMGSGFAVEEGSDGVVRITGFGWLSAFDISTQLPETEYPINGLRLTFFPVEGLPDNGWGKGEGKLLVKDSESSQGTFVLTAIAITADQVPAEQVNLHQLKPIMSVAASSWESGFPPKATFDPRNSSGWSPALDGQGEVRYSVTFVDPISVVERPFLTLQVNFGYGQQMIPGRFQIEAFTGTDEDIDLPESMIHLLQTAPEQRSTSDWQQLWDYCSDNGQELWHRRIELANLQERRRVLTETFSTMVMTQSENPRETFVLNRGDYAQPTHKVAAGLPQSLPPLPEGASLDRLGLATWLTMESHPLTSRVAVNRFWQMLFGQGIVATAADFGSQGSWPTHPELLDWLAVEFREQGWDVKELIYLIVTSATYQQSSHSDSAQLTRDPHNEMLARGPRFRMSAEIIRDAALKASGLLIPRIGGPSVNPYTPGDPWREVSHYGSTPATAQTFVQDHGEKLYRRSLYTYWKRTAPPVNLSLFDAPNREVCVVGRPSTTTPLQSLVLLNDVQFVEASRTLAEQILKSTDAYDDPLRLKWAVLQTLGRPATEREIEIFLLRLNRERQRYARDQTAAIAFLSNGESDFDRSFDPAELAAWGSIASLLINHTEFITKY